MTQSNSSETPYSITEAQLIMTVWDTVERLSKLSKAVLSFHKRQPIDSERIRALIGVVNDTCGYTIDLCEMLNSYVSQAERRILEEKWEIQS